MRALTVNNQLSNKKIPILSAAGSLLMAEENVRNCELSDTDEKSDLLLYQFQEIR